MEELIEKLARVEYLFGSRDRKFIRSVGKRVTRGEPLTTRQGWAFIAIARNTQSHADIGMKKQAYNDMLAKPVWRKPLIPSVELKNEVRFLGDNMLGFRTSNGKTEIEFAAIKAQYSHGMKIIAIQNPAQLNAVIEFIGKWGFEMDQSTEQFLANTLEHSGTKSQIAVDGDKVLLDIPNQHVLAQFTYHVLGAKFL